MNESDYSEIIIEFKTWLGQKSVTWYKQQHTSRHPYKKLWSIFSSERCGHHTYNNYKIYSRQIMSVLAKQLYLWDYTNMMTINEKRKAKVQAREFFIKI